MVFWPRLVLLSGFFNICLAVAIEINLTDCMKQNKGMM
jgi:hypothetical protein